MKKLLFLLVLFMGCAHADELQIDHTFGASTVAFSPDAKRLAVVGSDGVKIYETATGKVLETRKACSFGTNSLAWSPDGKSLAAGGMTVTDNFHGEIVLWRENQSEKRWLYDNARVQALRFSPDGRKLWSATAVDFIGERTSGTVRIWDILSGKLLKTLDKHFADGADFASSRDGKWVVCQTSMPDMEHYSQFDATTGSLAKVPQAQSKTLFQSSSGIAYSNGTQRAEVSTFSGADFQNYQYTVTDARGKRLHWQDLGNRAGNSAQLKFPYVAATVAKRYFPGYESQLKIWKIDPKSWQLREIRPFDRTLAPTQLTASRDGKRLFVQTNKGILELDALTLTERRVWPQTKIETIQFPAAALSISDDGQRVFNGHWYEVGNQKPHEVVSSEKLSGVLSRFGALSPDGKWLLAPHNGTAAIYDDQGKFRQFLIPEFREEGARGGTREVKSFFRASFSPTAPQIVGVVGDGGDNSEDGLYLFDFAGKLKHRFVDRQFSGYDRFIRPQDVVFSHDGNQIFAIETYSIFERDKEIRLSRINVKSGSIEKLLKLPQKGQNPFVGTVRDLILSPDGSMLAFAAFISENRTIKPRMLLFDTMTLQQITSLPLNQGMVDIRGSKSFAFNSNNDLLMLNGPKIEVWNPRTHSIVKSKLLQ